MIHKSLNLLAHLPLVFGLISCSVNGGDSINQYGAGTRRVFILDMKELI